MDTVANILKNTMNQMSSRTDGTVSSAITPEERFYLAWEEDRTKRDARLAQRIKDSARLGERFKKRTFDTFEEQMNVDAYAQCRRYVSAYSDTERNSLVLMGGYGTGKTHLASAITNALLEKGVPVLFDTYTGHLNRLKKEFDTGESGYLEKMQNVPMLVLDDVGKEKVTEWSRSIMFDVINYRYEHLLPFVMTSNLGYKDLEEYLGGAVWSRMCEVCIGVKTGETDYRKGNRE